MPQAGLFVVKTESDSNANCATARFFLSATRQRRSGGRLARRRAGHPARRNKPTHAQSAKLFADHQTTGAFLSRQHAALYGSEPGEMYGLSHWVKAAAVTLAYVRARRSLTPPGSRKGRTSAAI